MIFSRFVTISIFLFYSAILLNCDDSKNQVSIEQVNDANYVYIISKKSLVLRAKPTTDSVKLGTMPPGTRVGFIEQSSTVETIDELTAPWIKVDFNGQQGWAFGGYLSRTQGGEPLIVPGKEKSKETAEKTEESSNDQGDEKPGAFSKAKCPAYKTCVQSCDSMKLPYDATDPDGTARITGCVAECDNQYGIEASNECL